MKEAGKIFVSDCTLRDFRNAPGVHFDDDEAVNIARLTASLGVDELEVGLVGNPTDNEIAFIKRIHGLGLPPDIATTLPLFKTAAIEPAVAAATEAGCDTLVVSLGISEPSCRRSCAGRFAPPAS